jgi:hypothetical protein
MSIINVSRGDGLTLAVDDLGVCAWTEECKSLTWLRRMSNHISNLAPVPRPVQCSLDPVDCQGLDQDKYFRTSFRFRHNLQTSSLAVLGLAYHLRVRTSAGHAKFNSKLRLYQLRQCKHGHCARGTLGLS